MITIIMPAYNAENTIKGSIQSILEQNYEDIHLLVINDGSTDSTESIVKSMVGFDSRIELITIPNSGPANARNYALDQVKDSKYVMFCDADDQFDKDFIKKLLISAQSDPDIIIGGFKIVNSDGTENEYYEPTAIYNRGNFGTALPNIYKANLINQPWAKLYKAELVKEIRFPDYRWGEDRPFVFDCLIKAKKIGVCSYCGYKYVIRPGESLISGYYEQKPQVCVTIDQKSRALCEYFNVRDDSCFRYMFTKSIFSCFATLYAANCPLSDSQKKKYVSVVLNNRYIQSRISPSGGFAAETIYKAMKTRNASLNLTLAKAANIASKVSPNTFQKIKHKK